MITQILTDCLPYGSDKREDLIRAGLPVAFVQFAGSTNPINHQGPREWAQVQTHKGTLLTVPADCVSSGVVGPEETITALSTLTSIGYDTLVKAAREGRILARKSGNAWLSTARAVEYAIEQGTIKPRQRKEESLQDDLGS